VSIYQSDEGFRFTGSNKRAFVNLNGSRRFTGYAEVMLGDEFSTTLARSRLRGNVAQFRQFNRI